MASPTDNLFGTNERFKSAVALINSVPPEKFPLVLQRIIQRLHIKNEPPFSEAEQTQLLNVLKLQSSELQTVLDSCSFIYEQAAYYGLAPDILSLHLEKVGIATAKIMAFDKAWREGARELITQLRKKSLVPHQLETVNWRLHIQMGQSTLSRLHEPAAILDFGLSNATPATSKLEATDQSDASQGDHFAVELSHEQLYDFFTKLETIQEQLDNLG